MGPLILLICLWGSVHGSVKITSVEKKSAIVGGNVTLQCQLITSHPNIFQITWQKESGNFTGTVATFTKEYGQKFFGYSSKRMEQFTVDTLNVSAIIINPVTKEDHGCFKCIFNIYPFGANTGRTCLDVYETNMLNPKLEVHETVSRDTSEKLHVVTCSVTGHPALIITWKLPDNLEITPQNYTIINPNRTVTIISNFTGNIKRTLERTKVTCVVCHPAFCSDVSEFIDDTRGKDPSMRAFGSYLVTLVIISVCIVALILVVGGIIFYRRSIKQLMLGFTRNRRKNVPQKDTLLGNKQNSELCTVVAAA